MGIYIRPSRFFKIRVTRRGLRWAPVPPGCMAALAARAYPPELAR